MALKIRRPAAPQAPQSSEPLLARVPSKRVGVLRVSLIVDLSNILHSAGKGAGYGLPYAPQLSLLVQRALATSLFRSVAEGGADPSPLLYTSVAVEVQPIGYSSPQPPASGECARFPQPLMPQWLAETPIHFRFYPMMSPSAAVLRQNKKGITALALGASWDFADRCLHWGSGLGNREGADADRAIIVYVSPDEAIYGALPSSKLRYSQLCGYSGDGGARRVDMVGIRVALRDEDARRWSTQECPCIAAGTTEGGGDDWGVEESLAASIAAVVYHDEVAPPAGNRPPSSSPPSPGVPLLGCLPVVAVDCAQFNPNNHHSRFGDASPPPPVDESLVAALAKGIVDQIKASVAACGPVWAVAVADVAGGEAVRGDGATAEVEVALFDTVGRSGEKVSPLLVALESALRSQEAFALAQYGGAPHTNAAMMRVRLAPSRVLSRLVLADAGRRSGSLLMQAVVDAELMCYLGERLLFPKVPCSPFSPQQAHCIAQPFVLVSGDGDFVDCVRYLLGGRAVPGGGGGCPQCTLFTPSTHTSNPASPPPPYVAMPSVRHAVVLHGKGGASSAWGGMQFPSPSRGQGGGGNEGGGSATLTVRALAR